MARLKKLAPAPDLTDRFTGGCEFLARVDVKDLVTWAKKVTWPEMVHVKGPSRPCVIVDVGFVPVDALVLSRKLMELFPGCCDGEWAITVINPGDYVPPHTDTISDNWVTRVHVPILSNKGSWFDVAGEKYQMDVGSAYRFNIGKSHSLGNDGDTMRVHLMFDVVK